MELVAHLDETTRMYLYFSNTNTSAWVDYNSFITKNAIAIDVRIEARVNHEGTIDCEVWPYVININNVSGHFVVEYWMGRS
jgi:hypothetical protein